MIDLRELALILDAGAQAAASTATPDGVDADFYLAHTLDVMARTAADLYDLQKHVPFTVTMAAANEAYQRTVGPLDTGDDQLRRRYAALRNRHRPQKREQP